MLKSWVLSSVAVLAFGAALALPQSASANWAGVAAANQANAEQLSDVGNVHWRGRGVRWRGGIWWGAPFVAAPFVWGAPYAYAYGPPRCGWVWSPRRLRNVWRCW